MIQKAVLVFGAITAIGVAGFFANETWVCKGFEDDYLNSVSTLRSQADLIIILQDQSSIERLKEIQEQELEELERALAAVYDRCGVRAGRNAARAGSEILFRQ